MARNRFNYLFSSQGKIIITIQTLIQKNGKEEKMTTINLNNFHTSKRFLKYKLSRRIKRKKRKPRQDIIDL